MKAGSFVVCVDDSNWDVMAFVYFNELPVKGKVYQVRRVIPNIFDNDPEDGIALEGFYGDWSTFKTRFNTKVYEEYHFRMNRFREVDNHELIEEFSFASFCE